MEPTKVSVPITKFNITVNNGSKSPYDPISTHKNKQLSSTLEKFPSSSHTHSSKQNVISAKYERKAKGVEQKKNKLSEEKSMTVDSSQEGLLLSHYPALLGEVNNDEEDQLVF